jgi:Predicted transcriptional regulators containing the CopG/Arc/MetJ DNA-binding domain and a metal-binding domain
MDRISMSIPKKLLNDFDDILRDRGYQSRSKGIRDAIKDYIIRYHWMNEIKGERVGVLTIYYDYHYTGVMEELKDIQNRFYDHIKTVIPLNISKNVCLDVVVVESSINHIKDMKERIQRLNGVEYVKLSLSAPVDQKL